MGSSHEEGDKVAARLLVIDGGCETSLESVFEEAHKGMVVTGRQLLMGVWCIDNACLSESDA
jgi:hypothetical protein